MTTVLPNHYRKAAVTDTDLVGRIKSKMLKG